MFWIYRDWNLEARRLCFCSSRVTSRNQRHFFHVPQLCFHYLQSENQRHQRPDSQVLMRSELSHSRGIQIQSCALWGYLAGHQGSAWVLHTFPSHCPSIAIVLICIMGFSQRILGVTKDLWDTDRGLAQPAQSRLPGRHCLRACRNEDPVASRGGEEASLDVHSNLADNGKEMETRRERISSLSSSSFWCWRAAACSQILAHGPEEQDREIVEGPGLDRDKTAFGSNARTPLLQFPVHSHTLAREWSLAQAPLWCSSKCRSPIKGPIRLFMKWSSGAL